MSLADDESEDVIICSSGSKAREEATLGEMVLSKISVELFPSPASAVTETSDALVLLRSKINTKEIVSARTSATTATRSTFSFLRLMITASSGAILPRIKDASKIKFSAPPAPMEDTLLPSSLTIDARGTRMMLSGAVGSGRANQVS